MNDYRPPSFSMFPPVIKNLLIANVVFYLATIMIMKTSQIDITTFLGLHYFQSSNFKIYQIITYLFLHDPSSIWHILSNMFALWMFGSILENYWGGKRFILFYLICGVGAAITQEISLYIYFHHIHNIVEIFNTVPTADNFNAIIADHFKGLSGFGTPGTDQERIYTINLVYQFLIDNSNTIGASGAIFGVLLAYGMLFPNTEIYLYFAIPVKAKYFVIFYGLMELYLGIRASTGDTVAHFAHLGGMVFGFFLILYWKNKRSI